ncbi:MAG: class I SAM-dependent methyltransferase [Gammaproteobacteria bacterium]|nr:class I SAM-dependent methyltransferase [Gammaproteobacteria bacterium]
MNKKEIYRKAVELMSAGRLFDRNREILNDLFCGSVDRFCDIALALQGYKKVLDVGSGHGVLLSFLHELGHDCTALDMFDTPDDYPEIFKEKGIEFRNCNVEIDEFPFRDNSFDAVTCCQVLEHFSHSPLGTMAEIKRVLRPGGILEVDVPNVVNFRNRSRILRGKHITFEYKKHYLYEKPVLYKGHSFYPMRHNREFTRAELYMLLECAGLVNIEVSFLKSRRHRTGLHRLRSLGSALRDAVPSCRKSLIAFAYKPQVS